MDKFLRVDLLAVALEVVRTLPCVPKHIAGILVVFIAACQKKKESALFFKLNFLTIMMLCQDRLRTDLY